MTTKHTPNVGAADKAAKRPRGRSSAEANAIGLATVNGMAVGEFDHQVRALRDIRVLAEAASAWVEIYKGCELRLDECASLFDAIAARCQLASDEFCETMAFITKSAAVKKGGAQ